MLQSCFFVRVLSPKKMSDQIEDLLRQLASTIGPVDDDNVHFVRDGNLSVAYDEGVRNYLMECVVAVLANQVQDKNWRSQWLRELLPEVTRRLDDNQMLFPADISGADLGIALCALGANPFVVTNADDTINMDSAGWKLMSLLTLSDLYVRATQSDVYQRVIVPIKMPPPPAENSSTRRLAQLPAEFLVMLVRMLNDVGFQSELIRRVVDSSGMPEWWSETGFARAVDLSVDGVKRYDTDNDEVLYAMFVNTRAVSALLRAAIAVDYARQRAQNAETLAALPVIKSWAIHTKRRDTAASPGTTYFSCVASKQPASATFTAASTDDILPLAIALEDYLHVWPTVVPDDMAWKDPVSGRLSMRLGAFLAARVPMLPTSATAEPRHSLMWLQRRDAVVRKTPLYWFVFDSDKVKRPLGANAGPYSFQSPPSVVTAMDVSASIDARLDANPFCRQCGVRLDAAKARSASEKTRATLYCGRHRHLAANADDE